MRFELTNGVIDGAMEALQGGLEQYQAIQARLSDVDVQSDLEFQRRFNRFYRVRRNAKWRGQFYSLFAEALEHGYDFRTVCNELHERTDRWEASFTSKLIATVDPTQPVIDSVVLKNLDLRLPSHGTEHRLDRLCDVHRDLKGQLEAILKTEPGKYIVEQFRTLYPKAKITPIKMVDLVLWQIRPTG